MPDNSHYEANASTADPNTHSGVAEAAVHPISRTVHDHRAARYRCSRPQPTETAESVLARNARFRGLSHFTMLPGLDVKRHKGIGKIQAISKLTGISVQDLLRNHTCAPYQQAFSLRRHATTDVVNPNLPFLEDMNRGRTLISARPRFCPDCVAEDIEWFKYTIWRRHHQILGVDTCCKHLQPLLTANVDPHLDLPGDGDCAERSHLARWEGHDTAFAKAFAAIALDLLDRRAPLPLKGIADALLLRVHERGLVGTLDKKTVRLTTGDLIYKRDPAEVRWIEKLISEASVKADDPRRFINNAVSAHHSNTAALIISALLLTESPDEASRLISNPSGRSQPKYRQISDGDFHGLYGIHSGRIERIARSTGIHDTLIKKRATELGLPPCGRLTKSDAEALRLIRSGETFDAAVAQASAHHGRVGQFLAYAAMPRLTELLDIVTER